MRTATIAEAKERLEELIAAARAGERVEIVDDGETVVALVPDAATSAVKAPRNPRMPSPEALAKLGITGEAELLLQALLDEREESW
jgi:prevent-host-death family protein